MLNDGKVLSFVKQNLGFPFMFIELTDDQILDYIKEFTVKEFSYYFPDTNTIGYNLGVESNRVPGKANEFYIEDDRGLEILNIKNIYFSTSSYMMFGHPPLGPVSLGELGNWALSVETAGWIKQFSSWDYTHEFKHPNIVRISPTPNSEGWIAIEYERMQPDDFSKIPNDLQHHFLELCLADIMIVVGRARARYADGNIKTPYGEVPLMGNIFQEGQDKKKEVLDKLTSGSLPNVSIDIG
jgi:hypothetical protein